MADSKDEKQLDTPQPQTGDKPGSEGAQQAPSAEKTGSGVEELTFTPEQQAKIDQIIAERLRRQGEKLKAEADEARKAAERQAEESRLAEQQKFQELADKRKAQLETLEPQVKTLQEQVERYRSALEQYTKAALEQAPDFVRPLLEKMDPVDQLQYLSEHAAAFAAGAADGPPKTPKPRGEGELSDDERKKRAWHIRQGGF
jgi:flagellar motility protein MotE (MotC chaperone)